MYGFSCGIEIKATIALSRFPGNIFDAQSEPTTVKQVYQIANERRDTYIFLYQTPSEMQRTE